MKSKMNMLPSSLIDGTLSFIEVSEQEKIVKRKEDIKKKYSDKIKTRKEGQLYYIYINRKQITSTTKDGLIDKIYTALYDFENDLPTLESLYPDWLRWRRDYTAISGKTLKEYSILWKSTLEQEPIVKIPLEELRVKNFMDLFRKWTKDRQMSRKRFGNIKSLLNGIYGYAIEHEIISHNPIRDINCRQFTYKPVKTDNKVYTLEEREQLLNYLQSVNTIYSLAIQLDFHMVLRIGELLSLKWTDIEGDFIHIQTQYLLLQTMNDDLSFNPRKHINAEHIKGYSDRGFRYMPITDESKKILEKIRKMNPDGEYILMNNGKQLNQDTFNRYLTKYCKAVNIPSKSSHHIRFTVASMLYSKGLSVTALQQLLGHTTSAMTLHYLRPITPTSETYEAMKAILD